MRGKGSKQHKSSDGVPNRKGGSWPNHPSMRYELPIPFSPGAENVTDAYREGWDRVFGKKNDPVAKYEDPVVHVGSACEVCGDPGYHRLERGVFACEIES